MSQDRPRGRAGAEYFAQEGASVVINGRRREVGQRVAQSVVAQGDQVQGLVRSAVETNGRLDILVNNA